MVELAMQYVVQGDCNLALELTKTMTDDMAIARTFARVAEQYTLAGQLDSAQQLLVTALELPQFQHLGFTELLHFQINS